MNDNDQETIVEEKVETRFKELGLLSNKLYIQNEGRINNPDVSPSE